MLHCTNTVRPAVQLRQLQSFLFELPPAAGLLVASSTPNPGRDPVPGRNFWPPARALSQNPAGDPSGLSSTSAAVRFATPCHGGVQSSAPADGVALSRSSAQQGI